MKNILDKNMKGREDKDTKKRIFFQTVLVISISIIVISTLISLAGKALAYDPITIDKNMNFLRLGKTLDHYQDVISPKDMFYPTEQWERDFCYRDITKDLIANNNIEIIPGGGIYDTSITLSAYKTLDTNGTENVFEVAWYFHPVLTDTKYSISLYEINNMNKYDLVKDQYASIVNGDAGYKAIVSGKNFTKAVLSYNGQVLNYDIVQKEMS